MASKNGIGTGITRKEFIKRTAIGAAAVATTVAGKGAHAQSVPQSGNPNIVVDYSVAPGGFVVYPTGIVSVDTVNIQTAVTNAGAGGTILLKATNTSGQFTPFNLGTAMPTAGGTISVTKALTIRGEAFASPVSDRTVINGGFATFFVDTYDSGTNTVGGPVNFAMLESRNALLSFIYCKACAGSSISDVNVYDPIPVLPRPSALFGISFGIAFDTTAPLPAYGPEKISGDISVSRCKVDMSNSADGQNNCISFTKHTANVSVSDSQAIGFTVRGIFNVYSSGSFTVNGCEVTTTRRRFYNLFGFTAALTGGAIGGPVNISNNRISIDTSGFGNSFQAIGMETNQNTGGVSIQNNSISLVNSANKLSYPGQSIIGILLGSSNLQFSGNILSGIATAGIDSYSGNSITGNDLSGLTAMISMVCFGNLNIASGNVFGPAMDDKSPAIICYGNANTFSNNDFTRTGLKGFNVSSSGISRAGCIWLDYGTYGNIVNASLSNFPSFNPSYDPCTQIADLSYGMSPGNTLNRDFPCNTNQYSQLMHMMNQYARHYYDAVKAQIQTIEQMQ